MIKEEIIGKKFNHLTVVELDEERNQESWRRYKNGEIKRRPIYYLCKCDCGRENLVSVEKPSLMRKNNPISLAVVKEGYQIIIEKEYIIHQKI